MRLIASLVCLCTAMLGAPTAGAAVYQLDFSDADGAYAGTDAPAATGDASWFTLTDPGADAASNGTLTVDLGRAPDDTSHSVSFKDNRDPQEVSSSGSGIFGTALTQDAMRSDIVNQSGTFPRGPIGTAINGIDPGEYYVYVVAHHAGNAGDSLVVGIGTLAGMPPTGGDNSIFSSGTYAETALTASNTASWEQGNNYARGTVTIDGGNPVLGVYVASPGGSGGFDADNATIAAIQIVPVPEPASIPLVVLGSVFIATGGRRRREG